MKKQLHRGIAFILMLCLLAGMGVTANAYGVLDRKKEGIFTYYVEQDDVGGDYAVLYSIDQNTLSELVIPVMLGGYPVKEIGCSFAGLTEMTSVVLPGAITQIRDSQFSHCYKLEHITIPLGVQSIGKSAFYLCSSLTSVYIPKTVTEIGQNAFGECSALQTIAVDPENPSYRTDEDGTLYNKTMTVLYNVPKKEHIGVFRVPQTVTEIDGGAFAATSVTAVTGGENLRTIGGSAFAHCKSLQTVHLEDSALTQVGNFAFRDCPALQSVQLPHSVTSIGKQAFLDCILLGAFTVPNGVTAIADELFSGCLTLQTVTLPQSLESIGSSAFYGCVCLQSVDFPKSLQTVGPRAFYGCLLLDGIQIPPQVTEIRYGTFGNCRSLRSLTLHEGLKTVEFDAFLRCSSLESVYIPDSTETIGSCAFQDCTALKTVSLPQGICVDEHNFDNCKAIEKIIFRGTRTQWEELCREDIRDERLLRSSDKLLFTVTTPMRINERPVTLRRGEQCSAVPTVTIEDGVSYKVSYRSSEPSIASVDENGIVTAHKRGGIHIYITVEDEYGNIATDYKSVTVRYTWWQWILNICLFGWIWF